MLDTLNEEQLLRLDHELHKAFKNKKRLLKKGYTIMVFPSESTDDKVALFKLVTEDWFEWFKGRAKGVPVWKNQGAAEPRALKENLAPQLLSTADAYIEEGRMSGCRIEAARKVFQAILKNYDNFPDWLRNPKIAMRSKHYHKLLQEIDKGPKAKKKVTVEAVTHPAVSCIG